ncbi:MAG: HD domain-containing protein [Spirochaetales bacterium]|nr:HD domain-containing protein [Spirochaetales bacterium]
MERNQDMMIFKAIEYAAKAHKGQFRKGTRIPYIFHPVNVAQRLLEHNYPDDLVIAGLLHDTIEDTPVTADDIRKKFGDAIADLVIGASEKNRKETWENRKKETLEKLKTAPHDLLILSCADKLDNICSIKRDLRKLGESLWERFNQPGEKQKWYYKNLAQLFKQRLKEFDSFLLAEEFIKVVTEVFGR